MLLMDEIARQVMQIDFSRGGERFIDFVKACDAIPQTNLSVKQAQKLWEQFKRRLREPNRRESEFVTLTRMEIKHEASFAPGCEKRVGFLKRMKLYDQRMGS
jgi:3-methyladenine DNA glycosylase/8-oxoguanine DNA glycosylase